MLEEAKRIEGTPFRPDAKFIEVDATIARFDERGIADPLMSSVHDPIYQGAGPMGVAGYLSLTRCSYKSTWWSAFIDRNRGELHPVQMNKLLKILERPEGFFRKCVLQ